MSYLEFLGQWYNWPYLAALAAAGLATLRPAWFSAVGSRLGTAIGAGGAPGQFVVQVFGLTVGVIGLTVTGAVHDYWPSAQGRAFAPGLFGTVLLAGLIARGLGRVRARHFPEMKAVRFGTPNLEGTRGHVVSLKVSADYRAGRAQVMEGGGGGGGGEGAEGAGTVHVVLCKTRGETIPYAALVELLEYDEEDGRYYVEPANDSRGATANPQT